MIVFNILISIILFLLKLIFIPILIIISPFLISFLKLTSLDKRFLNWLNYNDDKSFKSAWELIDDANSIQISGKRNLKTLTWPR